MKETRTFSGPELGLCISLLKFLKTDPIALRYSFNFQLLLRLPAWQHGLHEDLYYNVHCCSIQDMNTFLSFIGYIQMSIFRDSNKLRGLKPSDGCNVSSFQCENLQSTGTTVTNN